MKATVTETDGMMWIHLEAENMKEAATIVRMKNIRKDSVRVEPYVNKDGTFELYITASKRRDATNKVRS